VQANNKGDLSQVYENASRTFQAGAQIGAKDIFKFVLKPLTIFSYHYFLEGIKAVQKDGPTKEIEKITSLSYEETIKVMEKCQKNGIRVVASERKLETKDSSFGKDKSMYQQKRLTRYNRRIKQLSNFKEKYPQIAKILLIDRSIKSNQMKHENQTEQHKDKVYNIYFNKSKAPYMNERLEEIIEYRTGISQKLFSKEVNAAMVEEIKREEGGLNYNSQELKTLADKFKLHEIGSVEVHEFKKDYCIHEIPFNIFMKFQNDLDTINMPYGIQVVDKVIDKDKVEKSAHIYFESKHLERYSELGFNESGNINVHGSETKNMEWDANSKEELVPFKTKTGEEEKKAYQTLSGKNYMMKKEGNECLWTIFRKDLEELAEKEKKRDPVNEQIQELNIFKEIEQKNAENSTINNNSKEIDIKFDTDMEKEGE